MTPKSFFHKAVPLAVWLPVLLVVSALAIFVVWRGVGRVTEQIGVSTYPAEAR